MWKPVIQNVKGLAKGGAIPESFNQIPSDAPELLASAGAQRSSPAEYLQSAAESFNAEQDWRQGHMLTGMQKERIAEERNQLQDAGKYLGMDVGLGTRQRRPSQGDVQIPEEEPYQKPPYQMQLPQRRQRPSIMDSDLGTSSLLGLQRGGTIDYRNGGTVAGGPPGVDTIPVVAHPGGPVKAMMNNGEYALPTGTVAAVGKPALDQLVVATTGQAPVGYACGGKMKYGLGGLIDKLRGRGKQIDEAVDKMVQVPPPPPEPPKEPNMADIMKEIRKKNPPVQGYAQGGMTELERKRMQAIDPRYAVAVGERPDVVRGAPMELLDPRTAVAREVPVPMRFAPTMADGNLVADPAAPGATVVATAADRVPDYIERPKPPMPRGGVQPYGQSMPEVRSAPTTYAAMPEAPPVRMLPQAATIPDERPGSIGSRLVTPVLQAIFSAREDPEYAQDRADRTRQQVAPTIRPVVQTTAPAVALPKDIPVAASPKDPILLQGAPTTNQLSRSSLNLTPDAFNPTGAGFVGTIGGAPQGVSDADYAKMSLPEKSAARVKSINEATAAIRDVRNARREAEGSPPVGGWARNQDGLAGLKPSEQIAYANLMRGLSNDQRAAVQDDFMNRLRVDERLEGRQKASNAAQDRFLEQSEPFVQNFATDFPGMADSAVPFFTRASQLGLKDPAKAYSTLAGTYEALKGDTKSVLFNVGGQDVTRAQAIAILNGEKPFGDWFGPGKDFYNEARRLAAQNVQELALQGLAK